MAWRDIFYFSKGERRALVVLLGLIAAAWFTLLLTDPPQPVCVETEVNSMQTINQPLAKATSTSDVSSSIVAGKSYVPKPDAYKSHYPVKVYKETLAVHRDVSPRYTRAEKYSAGTVLELNAADTTELKKVPGIGTAFANRIVKFRKLLGGFYTVEQLREVYGMDEERYQALLPWFRVDASLIKKLTVNQLPADSLRKHPYLDYRQASVIHRLRKQKGSIHDWSQLQLLEEFTDVDRARLAAYLSFE
ncbi:MAG: helix-hairpin-helix domain-containing protein [Tannerellaceae bacterium]